MKIQKVTDPAFRKYGKVLEGYNFSALLKEMKHTPVPEDVVYVPSVEELEALEVEKDLRNRAFGGLPVEIGYCNGHIKKLNAVEYHRNSEIYVAVTDLVLTTAVLVRNSLGVVFLLVFLVVGAGPVIRYGLLAFVYRFLAAVAQPVSDKRLVEVFSTMGEGCALLMRILFTAEVLCMLTFLILMAGGI